jgi:hypothetical protein
MSIRLRVLLESALETMSIRMLVALQRVGRGDQKGPTEQYHCSSSQAFELMSKAFRTMALPALTRIAEQDQPHHRAAEEGVDAVDRAAQRESCSHRRPHPAASCSTSRGPLGSSTSRESRACDGYRALGKAAAGHTPGLPWRRREPGPLPAVFQGRSGQSE